MNYIIIGCPELYYNCPALIVRLALSRRDLMDVPVESQSDMKKYVDVGFMTLEASPSKSPSKSPDDQQPSSAQATDMETPAPKRRRG